MPLHAAPLQSHFLIREHLESKKKQTPEHVTTKSVKRVQHQICSSAKKLLPPFGFLLHTYLEKLEMNDN